MPDDRWLIAGLGNPGAGYAETPQVEQEPTGRIGERFEHEVVVAHSGEIM